jgi:PST family polysaccharide transporter
MGLVITPIMIVAYVIGLPYGPKGVAFAYSAVMMLWLVPLVFWALHGMVISPRNILEVAGRPLISSIVAAGVAYGARISCSRFLSPLPRLMLESTVLLVVFFGLVLFVAGQKSLYLDILRGLRARSSLKEKSLVSA